MRKTIHARTCTHTCTHAHTNTEKHTMISPSLSVTAYTRLQSKVSIVFFCIVLYFYTFVSWNILLLLCVLKQTLRCAFCLHYRFIPIYFRNIGSFRVGIRLDFLSKLLNFFTSRLDFWLCLLLFFKDYFSS